MTDQRIYNLLHGYYHAEDFTGTTIRAGAKIAYAVGNFLRKATVLDILYEEGVQKCTLYIRRDKKKYHIDPKRCIIVYQS